jgi:hypothetical protein
MRVKDKIEIYLDSEYVEGIEAYIKSRVPTKGNPSKLTFDYESYGYDGGMNVYIVFERDETPAEETARLKMEAKLAEVKQKQKPRKKRKSVSYLRS